MDSCFVVMAIGDQNFGDIRISAAELRKKYDDLIKEAILKARPKITVTRADDIAISGTITTDIINRIMHATYMVVDVTYPNPNVFYEMGLRHACKPGTVIIKEKNYPKVPFDISHLRYIEYENTSSGLKELSDNLAKYFQVFDQNPMQPDNHLLEIASLTKYKFLDYSEEQIEPETKAVMSMMQSPEIMNIFMRQQAGEDISQNEILVALMNNPKVAELVINTLIRSGEINLSTKMNQNRRNITASRKGKKR